MARSGTAADATRLLRSYLGVPIRFLSVLENSNSSQAHYLLASNINYSSYTGDGTDSGIPNEWNNWGSAERGPSDFYQRHHCVASGLVSLPWKTRLGLTASVASGLPFNPVTGTDNNGDGYSTDRPVGLGRDLFRGPVLATVDISGSKDVQITEHLRTELRISVFNLLNRNNYLAVNNIFGQGSAPLPTFLSPIAGINNTDPSRQIQFGVRLIF